MKGLNIITFFLSLETRISLKVYLLNNNVFKAVLKDVFKDVGKAVV
jgi:hypothetical protein